MKQVSEMTTAEFCEYFEPIFELARLSGMNRSASHDLAERLQATGKPITELTVGELLAIKAAMDAAWADPVYAHARMA